MTSRPERKVLNMANAENAAPRRSPARMAGTLGGVLGYMLRQYKKNIKPYMYKSK